MPADCSVMDSALEFSLASTKITQLIGVIFVSTLKPLSGTELHSHILQLVSVRTWYRS